MSIYNHKMAAGDCGTQSAPRYSCYGGIVFAIGESHGSDDWHGMPVWESSLDLSDVRAEIGSNHVFIGFFPLNRSQAYPLPKPVRREKRQCTG